MRNFLHERADIGKIFCIPLENAAEGALRIRETFQRGCPLEAIGKLA
jgi:hypothetical protein